MLSLDPDLFHPEAVLEETRVFNARLLESLTTGPDMWSNPPEAIRKARLKGRGPFPLEPLDEAAQWQTIDGPTGDLRVRVLTPLGRPSRGSYLHFHGGGWVLGAADAQDVRLREIAENCGLTCLSVDYLLAPEHPFPAGPDDCEAAAQWLLNGDHAHPRGFLAIGGESAGAHLAALTLLRLRDHLGDSGFHAANLTAGVFDVSGSPSSRNWGEEKLVLNSRDMQMFARHFLQGGEDPTAPDISPFYATLEHLPPALFSIGTKDLLLEDSVLTAFRWHAANGNAELDITPGGCHVFQSFRDLEIARKSNARMDAFLNAQIDRQNG